MQVLAFSVPAEAGWRWRIVNYAGEMLEESLEHFPTISAAVEMGMVRLNEMDSADRSAPRTVSGWTWRPRR